MFLCLLYTVSGCQTAVKGWTGAAARALRSRGSIGGKREREHHGRFRLLASAHRFVEPHRGHVGWTREDPRLAAPKSASELEHDAQELPAEPLPLKPTTVPASSATARWCTSPQ